jgi:hypothetical protein
MRSLVVLVACAAAVAAFFPVRPILEKSTCFT